MMADDDMGVPRSAMERSTFRVEEIPGKGRGCLAARDIPAGES
jgi:hypothetical protein